jgi:sugar/nucleoside kinase (ribokinase family)
VTRLVAVADAVVDLVLTVPHLPARGGDVLAGAASQQAGGCGFNVLVAAARQGMPGVYAGAHGSGPHGDLVRAALAREGLAVLHPPHPSVDTGTAVTLVEPDGERTFVTAVGAEAFLDADMLAATAVEDGDAVYLSGYDLCYPGTGPAIGSWLATLPEGVLVVTDPGPPAGQIPSAVLTAVAARTDWWTCTVAEAAALTGEPLPPAAAALLAARTGGTSRPAGAVVRSGPDGCHVAPAGGGVRHVPAVPVVAVDTNGAGDCHVGVFVAGLLHGLAPLAAARRANAAAALAVTRRGSATAPTAAEVDALLEELDGPAPR